MVGHLPVGRYCVDVSQKGDPNGSAGGQGRGREGFPGGMVHVPVHERDRVGDPDGPGVRQLGRDGENLEVCTL